MSSLLESVLTHGLNLLVTSRPGRTCVGLAVGSVVACLAALVWDSGDSSTLIAALGVRPWHWVALGALSVHIPTLFARWTSPARGDKDIASALGVIEAANFAPTERMQRYRRLIAAVHESVADTTHAEQTELRARVLDASRSADTG